MIGVRDTVRELIALQMDEYSSDEDIAALQKRLNEVYDAYTESMVSLEVMPTKGHFRTIHLTVCWFSYR